MSRFYWLIRSGLVSELVLAAFVGLVIVLSLAGLWNAAEINYAISCQEGC